MKRKLVSVFTGLLLASIIVTTLTACGSQKETVNSSQSSSDSSQTSSIASNVTTSDNAVSDNTSSTVSESTAIDNIAITIPDEFEMYTETAQEDSTFFKLKVPATNTTSDSNNGANGTNTPNNSNNNNSAGTNTPNGGSNNGSNGTDNESNNSDNSDPSENITIRVINIEANEVNFQNALNNPATPESMTEYLTNARKLSNVTFTNYQKDITDDQIRYEYSYTYTLNNVTYTELEFSCMTKDKFVAITVYPKSDAYLQQAEQVLRQIVDSFNPYK